MERTVNFTCLLAGTLVFCVALLFTFPGAHASILTMTGEDSGRDVTVQVNSVFTIELKQTGGTGYLWEFDKLDGAFFEILTEETKPNIEPGLVGGPVMRVWVLRAKKVGVALIRMSYFRPWEGRDKAAETFELRVHIER
jgi:predicted secreted protein